MDNKQHKKSYTKPVLSSLGSVEQLTLNSSWSDYAVARASSKSTAIYQGAGHDIS